MGAEVTTTVCRMCTAGCGMRVFLQDGKIIKVHGLSEDPRTGGALCAKGLAATQLIYHPDRVLYPLKRIGAKGEGKWERITWDEALDTITSKLKEIISSYGAKAISLYRGQASDWGNAWEFVKRFMNVIGSPNVCTSSYVCHWPRVLAGKYTYGVGRTFPEYSAAKCIVLWGSNPAGTAEMGFRVGQIIQAQEDSAKLIVIDAILSPMASKADIWLQPWPGSDSALALGMLNVIITEQLYDKDFVREWTHGFKKLSEHVRQYTAEKVAEITGIEVSSIREVARTYATIKPACLYDGNALDQYCNSFDMARSFCLLRAITGNLDVPGGEWFLQSVAKADLTLMDQLPGDVKPAYDYPLMFQSRHGHPIAIMDAILTGKPYPVRAMLVQGANPALTVANSSKVQRALRDLDLLVVMDLFITRTTMLADIVLPAATSFEKSDLTAYPGDRTDWVFPQKKVIEPRGESWPDWKLWFELGKHMGYEKYFPWNDIEDALDERLKPQGATFTGLKSKPLQIQRRYYKYRENGFPGMPKGKVQLYSETLKNFGYNPLPVHVDPPESEKTRPDIAKRYPLVAIRWPMNLYVHTQHRNLLWLRQYDPCSLVRINPIDADAHGITNGDQVEIETLRGKIKMTAQVTRRVPPGVVGISWGWGEASHESGVNMLTDDEHRNPVAGSTSNHYFLCQVRAIPREG
ncbi:MAG: molybdopterin-dependent oxidoreductase [Desulfobacteraceae bacterium]|nr:molybdopterin-dependent oxidoreductase [Desulfobacteraceae bacterium]